MIIQQVYNIIKTDKTKIMIPPSNNFKIKIIEIIRINKIPIIITKTKFQ